MCIPLWQALLRRPMETLTLLLLALGNMVDSARANEEQSELRMDRLRSIFPVPLDHEPRQLVGHGVLTARRPGGLETARPTFWFMDRSDSLFLGEGPAAIDP